MYFWSLDGAKSILVTGDVGGAPTTRSGASTSEKSGRRLGLSDDYHLDEVGTQQVKKLNQWVWRHDHRRCANVAPSPREHQSWIGYE